MYLVRCVFLLLTSLVCTNQALTQSAANPLMGSEWGYSGQDTPFVRFEAKNRLVGHGGCNKFFGSYQLHDKNKISIGPLAGTRMMCSEDIMKQEMQFMKRLENATSFRRIENRLEILVDDLPQTEMQWRDWD